MGLQPIPLVAPRFSNRSHHEARIGLLEPQLRHRHSRLRRRRARAYAACTELIFRREALIYAPASHLDAIHGAPTEPPPKPSDVARAIQSGLVVGGAGTIIALAPLDESQFPRPRMEERR